MFKRRRKFNFLLLCSFAVNNFGNPKTVFNWTCIEMEKCFSVLITQNIIPVQYSRDIAWYRTFPSTKRKWPCVSYFSHKTCKEKMYWFKAANAVEPSFQAETAGQLFWPHLLPSRSCRLLGSVIEVSGGNGFCPSIMLWRPEGRRNSKWSLLMPSLRKALKPSKIFISKRKSKDL